MLTSLGRNLEDAFCGTTALKRIHQRSLDCKESPEGICWGVGLGELAIDDALIGALDGGSIRGQVERCHDVGFF